MEQVLGSPSTELLQRLNAKPTVHSAPTAQYNYKRVSCNCKLNIFVSKMFQQNELPFHYARFTWRWPVKGRRFGHVKYWNSWNHPLGGLEWFNRFEPHQYATATVAAKKQSLSHSDSVWVDILIAWKWMTKHHSTVTPAPPSWSLQAFASGRCGMRIFYQQVKSRFMTDVALSGRLASARHFRELHAINCRLTAHITLHGMTDSACSGETSDKSMKKRCVSFPST